MNRVSLQAEGAMMWWTVIRLCLKSDEIKNTSDVYLKYIAAAREFSQVDCLAGFFYSLFSDPPA